MGVIMRFAVSLSTVCRVRRRCQETAHHTGGPGKDLLHQQDHADGGWYVLLCVRRNGMSLQLLPHVTPKVSSNT